MPLAVEGRSRKVMPHCTAMTPDPRHDLNDSGPELGELIDLEVIKADRANDKIFVRDLPDLEDTVRAA